MRSEVYASKIDQTAMRLLLLGMTGQVGWELQRSLAPLGELVPLDLHSDERLCCDFTRPEELAQTVRWVAPDVIVNAAAYTAVDRAESEPGLAHAINAEAPAVLAREAARLGAWLVHYSTDYVFNGSGSTPWSEESPTGPLNVYGESKAQGDLAIRSSGCLHLILRTSWVYSARGGNFARSMLQLAGERDKLTIVSDQIGAPTGAELLADSTAHAVRRAATQPHVCGTYHVAAAGETSWHGYASFVIEQARRAGKRLRVQSRDIAPIASDSYPTPARRPLNSRLDTRKFRSQFDLTMPAWQVGVQRMLEEILG
jgi:dTDP-4-dehydrorhamnose reductase